MIANKYQIENEIKRGAFGCIFKGSQIKKREPVAIKIETGNIQSLKHEVKMINYLSNARVKQIPDIFWYGNYENNPCLVFTLYECSLFDYMNHREITIDKMNILMIKMIDILENIHKHYVLHRDLKPQNFMIKNGDIYLIDFGLATFFINENGEHYENKQINTLVGTPKFVSINVHMGNTYSRRDDMISIAYIYLFMVLNSAAWFPSVIPTSSLSLIDLQHPLNQLLLENKQLSNITHIVQENINENSRNIQKYITYVYQLEHTAVPKYELVKRLFLPEQPNY